jgi:hypothetical protein
LQKELINRQVWSTRKPAIAAVREHIALFYDSRRKHSLLGYKSPVHYKIISMRNAA